MNDTVAVSSQVKPVPPMIEYNAQIERELNARLADFLAGVDMNANIVTQASMQQLLDFFESE
jgi:hypothetical protein